MDGFPGPKGRVGHPDLTHFIGQTLDDFNEAVGTRLPQASARTMAGLVFNTLGRQPRPGDAVEVDSIRLAIEHLDGVRITRLRVELPRTLPSA